MSLDRSPRAGMIGALATLVSLGQVTSGCATVFHGSHQTVTVETRPAGAIATLGSQRIATPGTLQVSRKVRQASIQVEKPGYRSRTLSLERRTSGLVWSNAGFAIAGGVAGAAAALGTALSDTGTDYGAPYYVAGGLVATALALLVDLQSGGAYTRAPARIELDLQPSS